MFMSLGRWFQRQCRQTRRVAPYVRRPYSRLRLEWLEDRVVPRGILVNTTADVFGGATESLRNAIQQANTDGEADNTIEIGAGTYAITLTGTPNQSDNAAGEFAINLQSGGSLTIVNESRGAAIIDAQNASRVFDINPTNILFPASAHVVFLGGAGGIIVTNGRAAATDDANGSGGDIRDQGAVDLTFNNVTVSNGTGGGDGGGISMENPTASTPWTLTLNNSTVSNNDAQGAGGGIDEDGTGTVTINNSLITGNSAAKQGGGIWLDPIGADTAALNLNQSVVSNNSSGLLGAGLGNAGNGAVILNNSLVSGNVTSGFGGGFADENNLGTLIVQSSLFQNNTASGNGGALSAGGPTTTIADSMFQGNFSSLTGGALFLGQNAGGTPATTNSTFTIADTTLANNVANDNGGGIEFQTTTGSTSSATITNSTIAGDSALTGTGGGTDVASGFTGAATLTADTITNNFSATTGGVAFAGTAGGAVNVQDTIIALNHGTNPDVSSGVGSFTDLGNNLVGTLGGSTGFGAGTLTGPFPGPLVSALRDNGGPVAGVTQFYGAGLVGNSPAANQMTVQTEALVSTSAARGKGAMIAGLTTDQRGFPRPGSAPDVGAFQFQNANLVVHITASISFIQVPDGPFGPTNISVVVENDSPNALPADNSVLTLTLPASLTAHGPTTFTLPALAPFGQTSPFALTADGNPFSAIGIITARIVSPDANPVLTQGPITGFPATPQPAQGQLMVFALGFVNRQLVLFYVDSIGHIFYEPFTFTNFFSPDPSNAVLFNTRLAVRNMAPTDVFGSPGIVGFILDVNGNADLATTVPLNFIAAAALQDLIFALQEAGA